PPGLAMVAVGQRAWAANRDARLPRFYWDYANMKKTADAAGSTPFTPAIAIFYGLDEALKMIVEEEGLENALARHARVARRTRERVRAMGLEPFAPDPIASHTVTAVRVPSGLDVRALLKELREERNVVLAGGLGRLQETTFRVGHLGAVDERDVD